jgi:hypothetical protein
MTDEPQNDPAERDPAELEASGLREDPAAGSDPVAASRALERAAERLLARSDLDERQALDVRSACEQLVADRTNGEALDDSMSRLREVLAQTSERTSD